MKLHLDHQPANPGFFIGHSDKVFFSGSCFSENMLEKMRHAGFSAQRNPAGTIFHPLVMAKELDAIVDLRSPDQSQFLQRSDNFYSFEAHSDLYEKTANELEHRIISDRKTTKDFLRKSKVLILSFGSAFYYRHLKLAKIVANCHKQPQQDFEKILAGPEEIIATFQKTIAHLRSVNPDLRVLLTVSPVKHLRDGVEANTLSKSILRYACHALSDRIKDCYYFPAYELITDDLRDYRFFEKDLAHPNQQAIDYVWDKFSACYFNSATQKTKDLAEQLHRASRHVFMHQGAEEKSKFEAHIRRLRMELAAALQAG